MAKADGHVVSCDESGIIIEYTDGKQVGIQLGRIYGSAAGLTIPHTVRATLKAGDKFSKFDPIAYNTNFFEPDVLDPKRIIWKTAMLVNTVLFESPDTLEDSSSLSKALSVKMSTKKSDIKNVIVNFDQEIHRMVTLGEAVESDTALCLIEDAISAMSGSLDDDTISTLRELDSQAPRAKVKGIVEEIEIYYNGDFDEMSETLQKLVLDSNKRISIKSAARGEKINSGAVGEEFRIGNDPLLLDTACIRFYITSDVGTGIGDKGVFANQLKTVFGNVFDELHSEYGENIDAIFGQKSESDRIVSSAAIVGTTNTLESIAAKRVIAAYEGL